MKAKDRLLRNYRKIRADFLDAAWHDRCEFAEKLFKYNYLEYISDKKSGNVLEIGCNDGAMLCALKSYNFENIYGIDMSIEDCEIAKNHTNVENIFCVDAFDFLPKKKDFFDVIISKATMEHIDKAKQELFVKLIYESLKEGGVAVIDVPNMDWLMASHDRYMDYTHEMGYTRESLGDMFRFYFDHDKVDVYPVASIFPKGFREKIKYKVVRPILIKMLERYYEIIGDGANSFWFEYRQIMVIAKK